MPAFTALFIAFLLADVITRGWIALRQIKHVGRKQNEVPEQFRDRISLHSHQRAAAYTRAKVLLGLFETLVSAVLLIALTLLGGLQWLNVHLARLISNDLLFDLALIGSVFAIVALISLPFSLWRKFKIEARFGFNRVTPRLFALDLLKTTLLSLVFGIPLLAGILWLMTDAGPSWGWWAWLLWVGFNFLLLYLFPTVIAPLFNTFTRLDNPDLQARIRALAKQCNFAFDDLFVMDGSRRSAHGNAYFTGFGKARRIVLFDTLINKLSPDEIEAVVAHELGHYQHKHILKRMLINFFLALLFFQTLAWLSQQVWFYLDLGVIPVFGRSYNGLALILFFLVTPTFTFWVSPFVNRLSRRDEYEADRFAAQHSNASSLVSALVKLYNDNAATLTPDPIHSAFYDSHPPAVQRIQQLQQ